jgi:transposase
MPRKYSDDLRVRVIKAVEAGASRREAAQKFNLSASSAARWLQRWNETRSARAKPGGGSVSPLERHADQLWAIIEQQPDLTLDKMVAALRKKRIRCSRTAIWRFFERHNITLKKASASPTRSRRRGLQARERHV